MYTLRVTPPRGDASTQRFNFVMTDEERAMLDAVAAAEHRSGSDWIRLAIRRAYEALPKKKPAKK
jgi:uncharacterized protein (DUF1778 family)